jgi:tetratricopeptide (TPR) repeat protein
MIAVAMTMLTAGAAWSQIAGVITTTENKTISGSIKWKIREKVYAITANNVEIEMPLANIKDIQVPKPKELDAAIANVQSGSAAAAIPVLEKISTDYLMLQWDTVATRLLAEAYVKAGEPEKAIRVCEKIIAANPEKAYLGEMAPAYWQAMVKAGRTSKVEDLIAKAVKSGDREASAFALLMRGDLILATGETNEIAKKALRDGFLRVVTLYKSVKTAQPEALYKAAKCFEKLGQTARADQMRTTLKSSEFAASEWARKP